MARQIRNTCQKHQDRLLRWNSSDHNLAKLIVLKRHNTYLRKQITSEKWTVKSSFPQTLTSIWEKLRNRTASHSKNSFTRIKGCCSSSMLQTWTQTTVHTFPSTKTWPNNKFGISTKKEDSSKSPMIHLRPLSHQREVLLSMRRVPVWLELHLMTRNLTSLVGFGSQMVEARPSKMMSVKGMSWQDPRTKTTSQSMANFLRQISSQKFHSQQDGQSLEDKVKLCVYSVDLDMKPIMKSKETKKHASRTTKDVKCGVNWHHKSRCHSRESLPLQKNLEREKLKP